jgi:hypothetical protein
VWSTVVGFGGLLAALVAANAIDPTEAVAMGGGELATSAYLRLFLILGSIVGGGLAVTGLAGRTHRDLAAVTLATLGFAAHSRARRPARSGRGRTQAGWRSRAGRPTGR